MGRISEEQLRTCIAQLESELNDLKPALRALRETIAVRKEELSLMSSVLQLREREREREQTDTFYDSQIISDADVRNSEIAESIDEVLSSSLANGLAPTGDGIELEVKKILARPENEKQPMHIDEIIENLKDAGVKIPGKGQPSNIIVRLRRDHETFTRTGRGEYALAEWGLKELKSKKRRKSRRNRA
jgi:hypothetical protein